MDIGSHKGPRNNGPCGCPNSWTFVLEIGGRRGQRSVLISSARLWPGKAKTAMYRNWWIVAVQVLKNFQGVSPRFVCRPLVSVFRIPTFAFHELVTLANV